MNTLQADVENDENTPILAQLKFPSQCVCVCLLISPAAGAGAGALVIETPIMHSRPQ